MRSLRRLVKVALLAVTLSVLVSVAPSANADDTYERICLTMGWTSCGEWTIYDVNGVEKNRVVGPTPLSALLAICGVNMCGGGVGGSAVQTGTYSPPTSTELADRAAAAEAARIKAETLAIEAARVAAASASTTVTSTPSSPPTPTPPTGLGGYAIIHPDGHVCGVIVGNSYFAGNDKTMTSEYMGCPIGAAIIFQTKPSPSGNVAGWHGADVFYFNGIFILGNGTTISNGIATDTNGRVWDTGSGDTIKAGIVTTPTQSDTKTATTQSETKTASSQTNTSSTTTQSETKTATTQSETKTATTQSETKTATTQSETNTVSPQTNTTSTNTLSETKSANTSDAIKSQQSVVVEKVETVVDSDGEEVAPEANLKVKKDNAGRITFTITSNLPEEAVIITASKKGSKSIRYSVTTNDSGRASLRTTRNLSGYTLTLRFDSEVLDQLKFKG